MKLKNILICLTLITALFSTGCTPAYSSSIPNTTSSTQIIQTTVETGVILKDTVHETPFYIYDTHIEGPTILIVGGIHGNETAGFTTAKKFLDYKFRKGKVVMLPTANILAANLDMRYPGETTNKIHDGVTYSDLNRTFPGKVDGTRTEQIAYAITEFAKQYKYDMILDLHESVGFYTNGVNMGSTIIYSQDKTPNYNGGKTGGLIATLAVEKFNENHLKEGELPWIALNAPPKGSINRTFTQIFECPVFTIETNRKYYKLEERIEQQTYVIEILLRHIWGEEVLSLI